MLGLHGLLAPEASMFLRSSDRPGSSSATPRQKRRGCKNAQNTRCVEEWATQRSFSELRRGHPPSRFEEQDNTEHSAVLASRSCVLTTESKLMPTSFFHRAKTKLMRTTRKR